MSQPGVELIIGGRNDADWGPVILAGFGGVQAEILKDVRLLAPDLSLDEIIEELTARNIHCPGSRSVEGGLSPIDSDRDLAPRVNSDLVPTTATDSTRPLRQPRRCREMRVGLAIGE